jgi:hypothetical protein
MAININAVFQSGIVQWPAIRYGGDGKPEFRFSLYRETQSAEGQTCPLSIPCWAVGTTAERLAGELHEGIFIVITVGELCYRKRQTKLGEISQLEILVWRVQVGELAPASVPVAAPSMTDAMPVLDQTSKKGKPRYPKWRQESSN